MLKLRWSKNMRRNWRVWRNRLCNQKRSLALLLSSWRSLQRRLSSQRRSFFLRINRFRAWRNRWKRLKRGREWQKGVRFRIWLTVKTKIKSKMKRWRVIKKRFRNFKKLSVIWNFKIRMWLTSWWALIKISMPAQRSLNKRRKNWRKIMNCFTKA